MRIGKRKNKSSTILEISGSLTAANSLELKKSFQEALKGSSNLVLILKNIDEVDLSFIQILASTAKTAVREGRKLELESPVPDLLNENVKAAGLLNHGACQLENCLWCQMQHPDSRSGING